MLPSDKVTVTCYNKTKEYTRGEAIEFFADCMVYSEGSEFVRYAAIMSQLMEGKSNCSDE